MWTLKVIIKFNSKSRLIKFNSSDTTHHMREINRKQVYRNGGAEAGDHGHPHEAAGLALCGRGRRRAAVPGRRAGLRGNVNHGLFILFCFKTLREVCIRRRVVEFSFQLFVWDVKKFLSISEIGGPQRGSLAQGICRVRRVCVNSHLLQNRSRCVRTTSNIHSYEVISISKILNLIQLPSLNEIFVIRYIFGHPYTPSIYSLRLPLSSYIGCESGHFA